MTESGSVLPVDWWPIRTSRGNANCVSACVYNITTHQAWIYRERERENTSLDHTMLRKSSSQSQNCSLFYTWHEWGVGWAERGWRWMWRPKCRVSTRWRNYFQTFTCLWSFSLPLSQLLTVRWLDKCFRPELPKLCTEMNNLYFSLFLMQREKEISLSELNPVFMPTPWQMTNCCTIERLKGFSQMKNQSHVSGKTYIPSSCWIQHLRLRPV